MIAKLRNSQKKRISIVSFTAKKFGGKGDAYSQSLHPALRDAGAEITEGEHSRRWLSTNRKYFDCVLINWPSFFYSTGYTRRLTVLTNFAKFMVLVCMLKLWRMPMYWTAHNLYPHEPCLVRRLDWLARIFVITFSRKVFVHGPAAEEILIQEFPSLKRKTVVIDHGHWVDFYPNGVSRSESRLRLGLGEEEFVFLFIGVCKEYKNLDGLLRAFEKIEGNTKLLIAGSFTDKSYFLRIQNLVEKFPKGRVLLRSYFIPDEDIKYYLTAANAVVLPYTEILTSGSAVLALSFGRPVVAPRRGHLIDLIRNDCGVLYRIDDPEDLILAMSKCMNHRFDEELIRNRALKHDWSKTAKTIIDVVRQA